MRHATMIGCRQSVADLGGRNDIPAGEQLLDAGQAPIVDTQNVMQSKVISRTTLDAMPLGQGTASYAAIIPEVTGEAHIVGRNELWINPNDPLKDGFILR
jgi:hypothetical protein